MSKQIHVTFLLCMLLLATSITAAQQTDDLKPIYNGPVITNFRWSEDGTVFTFQDGGYQGRIPMPTVPVMGDLPQPNSWFALRPNTAGLSTLSNTAQWEQTNTVSDNVLDVPNLATDPSGQIGFIFPSPDGRFVVYPGEPYDTLRRSWPLVIWDRENNQTISTGIYVEGLGNFTYDYNIVWGPGSNAFTMSREILGTFYVTDFVQDVSNMTSHRLQEAEIGDERLGLLRSFSNLSRDGTQVLLSAVYGLGDGILENLLLSVNPAEPENSRIIARGQRFIGAAFSLDETAVYYVGGSGLVRHDLATDEARVLNAEITSERFRDAIFSPDMRYLALIEEDRTRHNYNSLYIISLTE